MLGDIKAKKTKFFEFSPGVARAVPPGSPLT